MRRDKHNYYLDIAETVAERSTCLRRHYGAIIVKNDVILSTGYNGAPRGRKNCVDLGRCIRMENNIPRGTRYELCRSVHAEANAIIAVDREKMLGSTLYLCGVDNDGSYTENSSCCPMCKRLVINAGIETVVIRSDRDSYVTVSVQDWVDNDGSLEGEDSY